jgi:hypothetical protein
MRKGVKPDELVNSDIMKGTDIFNRRFIVFKSTILKDNIRLECFTTFFQRYTDHNGLYHTTGHYGRNLFATQGGPTHRQIELLYELLKKGQIELTYEELREHRYLDKYDFAEYIESWDSIKHTIAIVKMGW